VGIPVLLLSAGVSGASRELGIDAGANDFKAKPFSPRVLVEKLIALSQGRGNTG
jgi:DNA-binding response OmpR family regulator